MTEDSPMRFGLVGTGYWAQESHATAIDRTDGIELTAIWGRRAEAVNAAAARWHVPGFLDFDEFLDGVDAVSFAVPPEVQSSLALRAIQAGKHVLLEKPIAVTIADADALVAAVDATGVSNVTFFTHLFDPRVRAIADAVAAGTTWTGAQGLWLGSALRDDNPFNTPWRHVKGPIWDLGPHVVSVLWATLGPIVSATATAGAGDLVHATCLHESGATSTATMTLQASDAADGFSMVLWGEAGRQRVPVDDADEVGALVLALGELASNARAGIRNHPCDLRFGRDVVRVLAEMERAHAESRAAQ